VNCLEGICCKSSWYDFSVVNFVRGDNVNCLKGICCNSSWHYCSVVYFLRGDTRIPWKRYTLSEVGIIVLSLISYGVIRDLFRGDMMYVKLVLLFCR